MEATAPENSEHHAFVKGVHGIRYHVKDVARAAAFYTQHLAFTVEHQQPPSRCQMGKPRSLAAGIE